MTADKDWRETRARAHTHTHTHTLVGTQAILYI
jgi:hypothetical protein